MHHIALGETRLRLALFLSLAAPLLSFSSIAVADQPAASSPVSRGAEQAATSTLRPPSTIRLTPLTGRIQTAATDPQLRFSSAYTRLLILSRGTRDITYHAHELCDLESSGHDDSGSEAAQPSFLPYNDRGWLARAFDGRHYAMNFTASLTVGEFQATVPLATVEHGSDSKDGERFVRLVNHSAQNFPLFLVRGDGSNVIASLKAEVRASNQYAGNTTGIAVQAATNLVGVLAPQSKVLTSLSSQKTKDAASGLDSALTALFHDSETEDQIFENDVRRWGGGVCLTLLLPRSETHLPKTDSDLQVIGKWKVVFEDPRPSIFSDVQICAPDPRDKTSADRWCESDYPTAARAAQAAALTRPAQVLEFELLQGQKDIGSVIGYLRQQDWWAKSIQDLTSNSANAEKLGTSAADFCRSIKDAIARLHLNEVDGGIVTAAVREAVALPANAANTMRSQSACGLAEPST